MKFTKMQGCGNDYVYVNGFEETGYSPEEKSKLAVKLSDRHFGIGSDGLIFINPSKIADFEMEMYNADGSRSEMCGNGIRCVGKYVFDNGLTDRENFTVESFGAVKTLSLTVENGKTVSVRVDMGSPILSAEKIPVDPALLLPEAPEKEAEKEERRKAFSQLPEDAVVARSLTAGGKEYAITAVSMGNPHAVTFMDEIDDLAIESVGPLLEHHPAFPARVNAEFVKVIDREHIAMRVWERGTGETLACGTGCCASAVACILNGKTEDKVSVKVLGGEIFIEWDREANIVYMTGPAVTVFSGEI